MVKYQFRHNDLIRKCSSTDLFCIGKALYSEIQSALLFKNFLFILLLTLFWFTTNLLYRKLMIRIVIQQLLTIDVRIGCRWSAVIVKASDKWQTNINPQYICF